MASPRYLGVSHPAVFIPRPRTPDGRLVVRYSTHLSASRRTDLSDKVCAVCGYGLTKLQMRGLGADPHSEHRAIPLMELATWARWW